MYKIINSSKSPINLFWYELVMLNEVFNLRRDRKPKNQFEQDALLESFLIHTRNIINFLSNNRLQQDDLTCSDFNDSYQRSIHAINLKITPHLKKKIDKHLSHLTKTRIKEKIGWDIPIIRIKLNRGAENFLNQCSQEYFPSLEIKQKVQKIVKSWLNYN